MPSPKGSASKLARDDAQGEPAAYRSPSLEVLKTLEIENAVSALESRLDSMEIDIARLTGVRDDDQRRIAGEMAVLRARVEDAVAAFGATAAELRETGRALERLVAESTVAPDAAVPREEMEAGIEGVTAGVGDVLEAFAVELRASIELVSKQTAAIGDALDRLAAARSEPDPVSVRLEQLERTVAGLLAAATRPA